MTRIILILALLMPLASNAVKTQEEIFLLYVEMHKDAETREAIRFIEDCRFCHTKGFGHEAISPKGWIYKKKSNGSWEVIKPN
jgi:hypothetical protein